MRFLSLTKRTLLCHSTPERNVGEGSSFCPRKCHGFTLIELIVTMAVAGIFFTLAMHLYSQAIKGRIAFEKKDAAYMQRAVYIAKTKMMLEQDRSCQYSDDQAQTHSLSQPGLVNTSPLLLTKHPGKCVDGKYILDNANAVMANEQRGHHQPDPQLTQSLHCKELKRGRIVVYNGFGNWIVGP